MTGFSAEWLALRAPADDAARDPALMAAATETLSAPRPLIADIGGGAGAALRALGPAAQGARWRIFDNDPALLAEIPRRPAVETVQLDLARDFGPVFAPRPDLVTGFAFFDLVSEDWLRVFVHALARSGAALYAPLIYDGVETWSPTPAFEAEGAAAFAADMRRDKGFGPALGPDAAKRLKRLLEARGYEVRTANSPWRLPAGPLATALAQGGADAAKGGMPPDHWSAWRAGRRAAQTVDIGHIDLLAVSVARKSEGDRR